MSQIDLFGNNLYSIGLCAKKKKKNLQKHYTKKKCKYELDSLTSRLKITLDGMPRR